MPCLCGLSFYEEDQPIPTVFEPSGACLTCTSQISVPLESPEKHRFLTRLNKLLSQSTKLPSTETAYNNFYQTVGIDLRLKDFDAGLGRICSRHPCLGGPRRRSESTLWYHSLGFLAVEVMPEDVVRAMEMLFESTSGGVEQPRAGPDLAIKNAIDCSAMESATGTEDSNERTSSPQHQAPTFGLSLDDRQYVRSVLWMIDEIYRTDYRGKLLDLEAKISPNPFPLMNLPAETRNRIYQMVLLAETGLITIRGASPRPPYYCNCGKNRQVIDVALLRVSRKVHTEAAGILYGYNTFFLHDSKGMARKVDANGLELLKYEKLLSKPATALTEYKNLIANVELGISIDYTATRLPDEERKIRNEESKRPFQILRSLPSLRSVVLLVEDGHAIASLSDDRLLAAVVPDAQSLWLEGFAKDYLRPYADEANRGPLRGIIAWDFSSYWSLLTPMFRKNLRELCPQGFREVTSQHWRIRRELQVQGGPQVFPRLEAKE
ncbi:MAG: hypothetical protein M1820_006419 [Bogoriella megaspora]|nr:MAG: hypothetical protein M1820_006419 [Bogoriella megaspora]